MKLKIMQAGEPVLRAAARPLQSDEFGNRALQELIDWMRETMRDAPGVGLAAPQVGVSLQIAVIEDRPELQQSLEPERLAERMRRPVPFQVLINPRIRTSGPQVEFFEGCLSVAGFTALVPRSLEVQVDCLDHLGRPVSFRAEGWHARIIQHEVDHLHGTLYVDRMRSRSLSTIDNLSRYWNDLPIEKVIENLDENVSNPAKYPPKG